jgi:hypothetical protein
MLLRLISPIQTELKKNVLSPLLLNLSLECAIIYFQENQEGFKLNEAHQLLEHADDINEKGENINVIKDTEALLVASKEVCLESDSKKMNYIFVARQQNARRWLTNPLKVGYGLTIQKDNDKSQLPY